MCSRTLDSRLPPAWISSSTLSSLSSTALATDRTKALFGASPHCRRWGKAGRRATPADRRRRLAPFYRYRELSGRGLPQRRSRGEAVGVQAFFQLGVTLGVRIGAEIGIRGLRLPRAAVHRFPASQCRLTLLGRPHAERPQERYGGERESKSVHRHLLLRSYIGSLAALLRFGKN